VPVRGQFSTETVAPHYKRNTRAMPLSLTLYRTIVKHARNQKVAGSIPDGVMELFIDINPSDRTMALRSTQPFNRNEYQEYILGVNVVNA
jgi:hypothetical protein